MTSKGVVRSIKNYAKGFSEVQRKVREATSNDPWGPSGTLMNEIAQLTYTQQEFIEIMDMIDKRLNDKGKNWRHVFKALLLLDYCLHVGSENVVLYAKENIYVIKTLKEFQHVDDSGRDVGANVRQKAKDITSLLMDDARLKEERRQRQQMRDRMVGVNDYMNDIIGNSMAHQRPREHSGDSEDRDLQRAIEESKRMAEDEERKRLERQGEEDLAKAIRLSEQEAKERERKEKEKLEKDNFDKLFGSTNDNTTQSNSFNPFPQSQSFDSAFNPYANQQQQQQQQQQQTSLWPQSQPFESSANPYNQQSQWPQNTGFTTSNFSEPTYAFNQQAFPQVTGMQNNPYQQQQQHLQIPSNPYQQMNGGFGQGLQAQMTGMPQQAQMTGMPSFQTNMMTGMPQQSQPTGFAAFQTSTATGFQTQQPTATSNNPFSQQHQQQQQQLPTTSTSFGSGMFGQNLTASPSLASATVGSSSPSFSAASTTAAGPTRSFTFPMQTQSNPPPSANDDKYSKLNALLANRDDGMDTFGNTGNLRIPYGTGFAGSIKPQSPFKTGGQPI